MRVRATLLAAVVLLLLPRWAAAGDGATANDLPTPDVPGVPSLRDEPLPAPVGELTEALARSERGATFAVTTSRDRFPSGRDRVAVEVFRPQAPGCFPVVVLLHGARPQRANKHYETMAADLARRGFVALYVRYYDRGRRGRGSRADWTRTIPDALTYASRLPWADGDRMAVVGYSLGAFLALTGAPSDARVRAVVAFYGGISVSDEPDAHRLMPPTLLLHGTADRIVPVRRSVQAFEALRADSRPADLVIYPGARHGFCLNGRAGADGAATSDAWVRTVAFLDHHLRCPADSVAALAGACDPDPEDPTAAERMAAMADPSFVRTAYLDLGPSVGVPAPLINPTAEEVKACSAPPRPPKRVRAKAGPQHPHPARVASTSR